MLIHRNIETIMTIMTLKGLERNRANVNDTSNSCSNRRDKNTNHTTIAILITSTITITIFIIKMINTACMKLKSDITTST